MMLHRLCSRRIGGIQRALSPVVPYSRTSYTDDARKEHVLYHRNGSAMRVPLKISRGEESTVIKWETRPQRYLLHGQLLFFFFFFFPSSFPSCHAHPHNNTRNFQGSLDKKVEECEYFKLGSKSWGVATREGPHGNDKPSKLNT